MGKIGNAHTLHILDSAAACGSFKCALKETDLNRQDVMCLEYRFETDCLPANLSSQEIERCIQGAHCSLFNGGIRQLATLNFEKYDRIVVWHGYDAHSLLVLYLISRCCHEKLYHCNVSNYSFGDANTHYKEKSPGFLNPFHFKRLLEEKNSIKRIPQSIRNRYNSIYESILGTDWIPKVAKRYQLELMGKERLKVLLLKFVTNNPKNYLQVVGEFCAKDNLNYCYQSTYIECLIFEMIEEGFIKPVNIRKDKENEYKRLFSNLKSTNDRLPSDLKMTDTELIQHIQQKLQHIDYHGHIFNRKYYHEGKQIGKWFGFDVVKRNK